MGNECVIVPNLGGFVAHNVSASYDDDEGVFLPPSRTLGFNPHLKMNDSLLVQSYVDAYDLSYPEAVDVVVDEVGALLQELADSGSYELDNLGRLYYDKGGKLNFEPSEAGIVTPELYAFPSFEMPRLTKHPKTINISLAAVRNASVAAVVLAAVLMISFPIATGRQGMTAGKVESGFYEMFYPRHRNANVSRVAADSAAMPEDGKSIKSTWTVERKK